jgi:polyisoprenoid-binding protein YceI
VALSVTHVEPDPAPARHSRERAQDDQTHAKENAMSTTTIEQTTTRWTTDPENTTVEFDVKTYWGLGTVHGRFDRFDGSLATGPDGTTIVLIVEADNLDTGNSTRDKHLRAGGFFNSAEHPQIRFVSTRVREVREGVLDVIGMLEAGGRSTPLAFPATVHRVGDELEVEATVTVDQAELGMSRGPLAMIRRPATVHVRARLGR